MGQVQSPGAHRQGCAHPPQLPGRHHLSQHPNSCDFPNYNFNVNRGSVRTPYIMISERARQEICAGAGECICR
jgi:hypothetical protein